MCSRVNDCLAQRKWNQKINDTDSIRAIQCFATSLPSFISLNASRFMRTVKFKVVEKLIEDSCQKQLKVLNRLAPHFGGLIFVFNNQTVNYH